MNESKPEATFVSSVPDTSSPEAVGAAGATTPAKMTAELEGELLIAHRKSVVTKQKLDDANKVASDLRKESQGADTDYANALHELAEAHRRDLKKGE